MTDTRCEHCATPINAYSHECYVGSDGRHYCFECYLQTLPSAADDPPRELPPVQIVTYPDDEPGLWDDAS